MICLEVTRNSEVVCIAGVQGGEMDGGVQWGSLAPGIAMPTPEMYVIGATDNRVFHWLRAAVGIGDVVAFRVIDAAQPDPPAKTESTDPEEPERIERRLARDQYARAKRLLKALEERWGSSVLEEDA
jgi:hypothetical protein